MHCCSFLPDWPLLPKVTFGVWLLTKRCFLTSRKFHTFIKGLKNLQIRTTCTRTFSFTEYIQENSPILSSNLLWESIYSVQWIPTVAQWTELVDSHSRLNAKGVLFGQFLTLRSVFWPTLGLFGENCQLRLLLVWAQ